MYKLYYKNRWGVERAETIHSFQALIDCIIILDRNKTQFDIQARNLDGSYRQVIIL